MDSRLQQPRLLGKLTNAIAEYRESRAPLPGVNEAGIVNFVAEVEKMEAVKKAFKVRPSSRRGHRFAHRMRLSMHGQPMVRFASLQLI